METPTTTLAQRLVMARGETGLQQDEIARGARISQQSYSDLETGKSKSTVRIGSLARMLGVDAYWLETGEGDMRPQRIGEAPVAYMPADRRRILEIVDRLNDKQRKGLLDLLSMDNEK